MSLINNPLVHNRLRRFAGIAGGRTVAPLIGSEVHPVVLVDDLSRDKDEIPEEPIFSRYQAIAAGGVGFQPGFMVVNFNTQAAIQAEDIVVSVIGFIWKFGSGQTLAVAHFDTVTGGWSADQGYGWSRRGVKGISGADPRSNATFYYGTRSGGFAIAPMLSFPIGTTVAETPIVNLLPFPLVIEPNQGILFTNQLDNSTLEGGVIWKESRRSEP